MSPTRRRAAGIVAAIVLLCGAAAGTRALSAAKAQARHDEMTEAADGARARAQDAVQAQLSAVEGRAVAAASNPVLRAQLGVVDAATLRDGMTTEPWWEPARRDFPISGIAAGEKPAVLLGADPALDFTGLLQATRVRHQAAAVVSGTDSAVLAGAAVVDKPGETTWAVLLARPLNTAFLEEVAARTRGGALLTNGQRVLLAAGPAPEQELLRAAVGKERDGIFEGSNWAGAASSVAPGVWLWALARPRTLTKALDGTAGTAVWGLSGLLATLALFLGFRPGPRPGDGPHPEDDEVRTDVRSDPKVGSDPAARVRSDPRVTGRSPPNLRTTDPGAAGRKVAPVARPRQFGRYFLVDRIGEGGMAEVYTAVAFGAESFRRAFVVKLLHGSAQRTDALVEMFIDEAKLASTLVHSNIIPVYDFGKMGDEYFMAQEYVIGRDLRRFVTTALKADKKPLDERLAVHIVREALRALEYAHTQTTEDGRPRGIVHRDVSPNNILVSARGEVKLFDFGIAKAEEGRIHQTQTGVVKGNVQYMSPEQARGEHVDARADVYSMGLVLYFLLAGSSLYRGDSAYTLLVQAAQGLTAELLPQLEKLPAQVAAVLRVALEPDREQRFQSAAAFDNALSRLPAASASELARDIQRLFGDELKAEQARFASIEPPPPDEGGAGEEEAR